MAKARRHRTRPGIAPLSPVRSRLFLVLFFVVTIILAYVSARAILDNAADPVLREKVDALRERRERNSMFAPGDTTVHVNEAPADTLGTR